MSPPEPVQRKAFAFNLRKQLFLLMDEVCLQQMGVQDSS